VLKKEEIDEKSESPGKPKEMEKKKREEKDKLRRKYAKILRYLCKMSSL